MRIKRFEDFERKNEGLGTGISTIGLLIALGVGNPSQILANKPSIEKHIDGTDMKVLQLLSKEGDSLIGKKLPMSVLSDTIKRFNEYSFDPIRIESVIKSMSDPTFPFKIDISYIGVQDKSIPISTVEFRHSEKITFVITKNNLWDKYIYGVKINF